MSFPPMVEQSSHQDYSKRYFRPMDGESITVHFVESKLKDGYRENLFQVGREGKPPVQVNHLECLAWMDHGVPDSPEAVFVLIREALRLNGENSVRPILVSC